MRLMFLFCFCSVLKQCCTAWCSHFPQTSPVNSEKQNIFTSGKEFNVHSSYQTKPGTYLVYLEVERLVLGPGRKTKARLPTSSKTGKCLGNIGRHLVHFCTFALFQYCNITNLFSMYVCAKHYLKIVPGEMARQTVFPLRSDQRRS